MTSLVKILDPMIDLQKNKYYGCLVGGSQTTKRKYDFQSFSNSSAQLAFTTPSPYTFMGKKWMLKLPVTLTFSGDSGDDARGLIQSGQDAFRSYPIMSILEVLDIKLNGQSSNLNIADIIKPLLLYHNNERNLGEREMSMTPSYRDQSQSYEQLDGSIRNPLASYYDSNGRDSMGRGAFPLTSLTNTRLSATVSADLIEELLLSPLSFGNNRETEGFINVQDVELNFTWRSNLSYMWSHSSASSSTINSISVTLGRPTLQVTYISPQVNMPIPRSIDYPYVEIKRYVNTNNTSLAAGASDQITSNNIQVGAIPRFVYLFLRKRNQDLTFNDTDSYAKIDSVQVNWDNQNALLSSATHEQLYDISRKNGIDINYMQFSSDNSFSYLGDQITQLNGIGSVLSIEFGTDIGLKPYECPGLRDTKNLQITVNYTNNHPTDSINFSLYLITIIPGIFRIYDRSADRVVGIINKQDVLNAQQIDGMDYEDLEKRLLSGSSKFTKRLKKIVKFGKKALPYVKKYGLPVAKKIAEDYAPQLTQMLDIVPSEKSSGSSLVAGSVMSEYRKKKRVGRPKGSKNKVKKKSKSVSKKGGEYMTKKQMMNRLMQY